MNIFCILVLPPLPSKNKSHDRASFVPTFGIQKKKKGYVVPRAVPWAFLGVFRRFRHIVFWLRGFLVRVLYSYEPFFFSVTPSDPAAEAMSSADVTR